MVDGNACLHRYFEREAQRKRHFALEIARIGGTVDFQLNSRTVYKGDGILTVQNVVLRRASLSFIQSISLSRCKMYLPSSAEIPKQRNSTESITP